MALGYCDTNRDPHDSLIRTLFEGRIGGIDGDNTLGTYRQCSEALTGVGEEGDRGVADTACSCKPLRGPMGIEWVKGAKGAELRRASAAS